MNLNFVNVSDLANMYRLLKPITSAQQTLLDEVQAHIKTQGLDAISGLKGETVFIRIVVYKYTYGLLKSRFFIKKINQIYFD